ncbi:mavicyanin-like [Aegilops tauschii subsp. strangulata]|uniref:Phytocyanin domain-containing protein n=2 Tax=Aegilops tauschii TaxID=37682 RepID=A0A452ZAV6_AEGTS|nr:mavicyanin-like [Aegilops tauschii subsp. strangulata]
MAAMKTIALLVVVSTAVLGTASAATHRVGEPGGAWDLTTDYGVWASSNKFHPGDELIFRHQAGAHNVLEVSKADYDSCNATSPITTLGAGFFTYVALPAVGTRYFICGIPGHCTTTGTGGMKLKIDVVPGSPSSSPAPAMPPPSSAAASARATIGFGLVVLLAAGFMA